MTFVRDERKARDNRRKQGVSFDMAARVFEDPLAVSYAVAVVEGEKRRHTIGARGTVTLGPDKWLI